MIANRSEKAFQMIKLIKSGRTLAEAKAMMKAVSVGLHSDFSKLQDIKDLQDLEGGMYRIRQTRKQRQGLLKSNLLLVNTRQEKKRYWQNGRWAIKEGFL